MNKVIRYGRKSLKNIHRNLHAKQIAHWIEPFEPNAFLLRFGSYRLAVPAKMVRKVPSGCGQYHFEMV